MTRDIGLKADQLRYDLLYAVEEGFSGQGLNFGRPEPSFQRVELFRYE